MGWGRVGSGAELREARQEKLESNKLEANKHPRNSTPVDPAGVCEARVG